MLVLVRIELEELESRMCRSQETLCAKSTYNTDKELCHVKWYKNLSRKLVKVGKIYNVFGCIRFQWHESDGATDCISPSKERAIISVESMKEIVRVHERKFEHKILASKNK